MRTLHQLKKAKPMRRVRRTVRGRGECRQLIIGIAQVHPVLSGKFERFQVRRIANVQAEIFSICRYLHDKHGVSSFGQEGYGGTGRARLPKKFLQHMRQSRGDKLAEKSTLKDAAYKWRKALHAGKTKESETYAAMLNALTVLQAVEPAVTVYPIEQADVHGAIGESLKALHIAIAEVESSKAYASAKRKKGKGLTQAEYDAAETRAGLIEQFNQVIRHPQRDKAILRQVLNHADGPITVFVLGAGHKSGMLKLAKKHLPAGTAFAWLEPPRLWWWKALLHRAFWGCIALSAMAMLLLVR